MWNRSECRPWSRHLALMCAVRRLSSSGKKTMASRCTLQRKSWRTWITSSRYGTCYRSKRTFLIHSGQLVAYQPQNWVKRSRSQSSSTNSETRRCLKWETLETVFSHSSRRIKSIAFLSSWCIRHLIYKWGSPLKTWRIKMMRTSFAVWLNSSHNPKDTSTKH